MGITPDQVFNLVVSLINFTVMFILFKLVVIEPMFEAVELREKRVRDRLAEIDKIMADANEMQAKYEAQMEELDQALEEIQRSAKNTVKRNKTRIEEKAEADAHHVVDKAKRDSQGLRREVEAEIRSTIASGAVTRARQVLQDALDKKTQGKTMEYLVEKVGGLSAS